MALFMGIPHPDRVSGSLPNAAPAKTWLPGLDALRAVAIVWVIAFHLHRGGVAFPGGAIASFVARGVTGVTLFFVISGFLITTLILAKEDQGGRIEVREFYVRRAFRILPAAFLYLAVAMGIRWWASMRWVPEEWLGSALFFRNLIHLDGLSPTEHFWSLSVEEQFYLLWPLLLRVCPARWRIAVTSGLCLAAPAWRHLITKMAHGAPLLLGRLDLCYDSLLIGALLALLQRQEAFRRLLDAPWLAPAALAGATGGVLALVLGPPPFGAVGFLASQSALLVCIAVVIKVLVEGRCPPIQALSAWKPVVWLGRLSYSLYLWQTLFCSMGLPYLPWRFPWNLAASLLCACASHYLVEKPLLRLRNRLWPD
jgi:peptidoglycan/LPS O-acetylase OafA/YrhL